MSSTVVTTSANLTGGTCNTLAIVERTRIRPSPIYATVCQTCGARATKPHRDLINGAARCLSSSHGRTSYAHSSSSVTTDSRTPATRSRDSRSAREYFREQQVIADEQSRRETEEREAAKAAQLAERKQTSAEKLKALHREWVETGRDPQLYVTPALLNATMPSAQAVKHNGEQAAIFVRETPEYEPYKSPASFDAIAGYFQRNGVRIADAAMIHAAFHRLRDLGILTTRPEPKPEPTPRPAPAFVNLSRPEPEPTPAADEWKGIDPCVLF